MKLWRCSWLYPLELQGLAQWKRKEILLESETEETIRQVLDYWAESLDYVLVDLEIVFEKEIQQ